jgi:hypothetical protein
MLTVNAEALFSPQPASDAKPTVTTPLGPALGHPRHGGRQDSG